jgi:antitoxin MazE
MKTRIVRIGNSKGIRLPKSVLDQCRLQDVVELEVKGNTVIVQPAHQTRAGWVDAFAGMAKHGDDKLLDDDADFSTEWEQSEWRW